MLTERCRQRAGELNQYDIPHPFYFIRSDRVDPSHYWIHCDMDMEVLILNGDLIPQDAKNRGNSQYKPTQFLLSDIVSIPVNPANWNKQSGDFERESGEDWITYVLKVRRDRNQRRKFSREPFDSSRNAGESILEYKRRIIVEREELVAEYPPHISCGGAVGGNPELPCPLRYGCKRYSMYRKSEFLRTYMPHYPSSSILNAKHPLDCKWFMKLTDVKSLDYLEKDMCLNGVGERISCRSTMHSYLANSLEERGGGYPGFIEEDEEEEEIWDEDEDEEYENE